MASCTEKNEGSDLFMQALTFAGRVPLFSSLAPDELPRLAGAFVSAVYPAGEVIIEEGDVRCDLFLVQNGKAAMTVRHPGAGEPMQVAELSVGDYFGESSLLRGVPATSSVVALEELTCWVLERADFEKLGLRRRLHFQKRQAVQEVIDESVAAEASLDVKVSAKVRELIKAAMRSNQRLGPLVASMSEAELDEIANGASAVTVEAGIDVVSQDDAEADLFYVVAEGSVEYLVNGASVGSVGRGGSFGELALLYGKKRTTTVRAVVASKLWSVPRQALRRVTQGPLRERLSCYARLLAGAKGLDAQGSRGEALADALVEMTFFRGEHIAQQGEAGTCLFVLFSGEVVEEADGREIARHCIEPDMEAAEFFGTKCVLEKGVSHSTSIRVLSERAVVLALERQAYLRATGQPSSDDEASETEGAFGCMATGAAAQADYALDAAGEEADEDAQGTSREVMMHYRREDLTEVGLLGCGSYARVALVRCNVTGCYFALKDLSKGRIFRRQQMRQVMTERLILKMTRSPFIIRLVATFRTDSHVSFLMEPGMGGDLNTVCERNELFYSARHARFYVACALEGVAHLHQRRICYRDLKLENMLLDAAGYCKLSDFGLSKFVVGHTYTFCGTPDFMAPEAVSGSGHTRAVDWWALGVVVYVLMTGVLPFDSSKPALIFAKVKRGIEPVLAITGFAQGSHSWMDLVRELCKNVPSERLPMRKGGANNVREHAWFTEQAFDWSALRQRQMVAPYLPNVRSPDDMSNFVPNPEDVPKDVKYVDPGDNWDIDFADSWGPRLRAGSMALR